MYVTESSLNRFSTYVGHGQLPQDRTECQVHVVVTVRVSISRLELDSARQELAGNELGNESTCWKAAEKKPTRTGCDIEAVVQIRARPGISVPPIWRRAPRRRSQLLPASASSHAPD